MVKLKMKRGKSSAMQVFWLGLCLLLSSPAHARGIDLHALWDDRCAECHGHSAEFSRKYLKITGGLLQGRHHVLDLRAFLEHHYPPAGQVEAIYQMLLAQTYTPPRFNAECSECHGRASEFMRQSIVLKDGELILEKTGASVKHFMQSHRQLTQDDIQFYMGLFTRLAYEIYRP